jgi:glutamate dehydrogenase (NAD(P)+)
VAEGANCAVTPEADELLTTGGVTVVPDLIANAGGVVVSHMEWRQNLDQTELAHAAVVERLDTVIRSAVDEAADRADERGGSLRDAAYEMAIERVLEAEWARGRFK